MPSVHRQHVGVAAEVRADPHVPTLGGREPTVEEDSLRARVAPSADHVPHVDAGRRADRRGGIAKDVPVGPSSDADLDRHDALPGRVDRERGRREADEVVDPKRDHRVEERVLDALRGRRGGREQQGDDDEGGPAHHASRAAVDRAYNDLSDQDFEAHGPMTVGFLPARTAAASTEGPAARVRVSSLLHCAMRSVGSVSIKSVATR
jgi:hypothetical protein